MNFLVWRLGLKGPYASLQLYDPRQSFEWKSDERTTIAIIALPENERAFTLDQAAAAHPCPTTEDPSER